jgi:hypothetical protein
VDDIVPKQYAGKIIINNNHLKTHGSSKLKLENEWLTEKEEEGYRFKVHNTSFEEKAPKIATFR